MKKLKTSNQEYFEAVIQLRNPTDSIIDYILTEIGKKSHVFISKEKKVKGGMDVYISSQHFAQNIGQKLRQRFGGILKISNRIFTRDKLSSKDVYRITVYYEAPPIMKNDIIVIENRVLKVLEVGKQLHGHDLKQGKNYNFKLKNLRYTILEKHKTKVTRIFPHVEVLHPETYQSVKTENSKQVSIGENVQVVIHDGIWLA